MTIDGYYARVWDKRQRDPIQGDFGKAWALDNPSGFRAYMVMSRYDPRHTVHKVTDLYGVERWLSPAGYRIMCEALLYIQMGKHTTTRALAEATDCCRQTVSRWITKLTAWGIIGTSIGRGKYGGIVLFARTVTDNLEHYANVARAKIRAARARRSNVTPPPTTSGHQLPPYLLTKGVTLDPEQLMDALGLDRSRTNGRARCPAHGEGRKLTLSWKRTPDRLLLHCFAGCTYDEIRAAVLG